MSGEDVGQDGGVNRVLDVERLVEGDGWSDSCSVLPEEDRSSVRVIH